MIGMCRYCKRMVSYDDDRCSFCGAERPVAIPWEVSTRPRPRRWPRALRRWGAVAAAAVALLLLVSLCSAGAGVGGS